MGTGANLQRSDDVSNPAQNGLHWHVILYLSEIAIARPTSEDPAARSQQRARA
jgi:hypothetical protein